MNGIARQSVNPVDEELKEVSSKCEFTGKMMHALRNVKNQYKDLQIEDMKVKIDKIMSASPVALDREKLVKTFVGLTDCLSVELENIKLSPINKTLDDLITRKEGKTLKSDIFWHIGSAVQQDTKQISSNTSISREKNTNSLAGESARDREMSVQDLQVRSPMPSNTTYLNTNYMQTPYHSTAITPSQNNLKSSMKSPRQNKLTIPVQSPTQNSMTAQNPSSPEASVKSQNIFISKTPQQSIYSGIYTTVSQTYTPPSTSRDIIANRPPIETQTISTTNSSAKLTLPLTPSPLVSAAKPLQQHAMTMQILAATNNTIRQQQADSDQVDNQASRTSNPGFTIAVNRLADISALQTTFGDLCRESSPSFRSLSGMQR